MPHVKPIAMAVLFAMYGVPGQAQPVDRSTDRLTDELELPERIERALRDMMEDVKPALDDALDYMRSLGAIDDPLNYEMPEVLPNGDIIIRRREDAPALGPDAPVVPEAPAPPPEGLPYDGGEGIRT